MFPVLLRFGNFEIQSYFVFVSLAAIAGVLDAIRRAKIMKVIDTSFFDLLIILIISSYVGSRLFHVVFEMPSFYLENPLEIFKVWKGGFVVYGAYFFSGLSGLIYIKIKNLNSLKIADILSSPFLISIFIGRLACFFNGCCHGRPTNSWVGITFPEGGAAPANISLHPTQLYMIFSAFIIWLFILLIEKKYKKFHFDGLSFVLILILYPTSRFIIEFFRGDFRGISLMSLSLSQVLSLVIILIGFLTLIKIKKLWIFNSSNTTMID